MNRKKHAISNSYRRWLFAASAAALLSTGLTLNPATVRADTAADEKQTTAGNTQTSTNQTTTQADNSQASSAATTSTTTSNTTTDSQAKTTSAEQGTQGQPATKADQAPTTADQSEQVQAKTDTATDSQVKTDSTQTSSAATNQTKSDQATDMQPASDKSQAATSSSSAAQTSTPAKSAATTTAKTTAVAKKSVLTVAAKATPKKVAKKATSAKKTATKSAVKVTYQQLLAQAAKSKDVKAVLGDTISHVTKDNFSQYFTLNGSASYDQDKGIVTITPNENFKVGNFALKSKINMDTSFTLNGQVNLGDKTSPHGGADGIGFAFHNGNINDVGSSGANLGIGGLQDAIGFKLDTYHNDAQEPQVILDGAQVKTSDPMGYGWSTDPDGNQYQQFGGFVDTTKKMIKARDGNEYSRWWAETDMHSVQKLDDADLDGQFHDFTVNYDGQTRNLTITYKQANGNTLSWSRTVNRSYQAMAMIVSASTGQSTNLQQFKIDSFDFEQAASVNVNYVDMHNNQIGQAEVTYPNGANVNGTYETSQINIPNYKFVKLDTDGAISKIKSLPATGTLSQAGDNGTVVYVYTPNQEVANVTYIDDTTRKTLSAKDLTGDYGSTDPYRTGDTIADYEKQGYQLVSDNYPATGVVYNQDGVVKSYEVHLTHGTTPVGPDNPQTPGEPINPDNPDGPKWPAGTDKDSLTTDVHQTIQYQYGDGSQAAPDKTDSTIFDHQVEIDKVTGEIVKDDGWKAENGKTSFDSKTSPIIPGYTASKPASDPVDGLTQDSKDDVQTIVYTKNPVAGGNVTAKYVDENGNPIADNVVSSGNVGDPYSTTQKDVPGYTFKEVQGNPTGSFTDKDQTVTYVYTKNPVTDNNGGTGSNPSGKPGNGTDTGNSSSNQPGNPSQPSNTTNNGVINTSTNTGSKVNNGVVSSPKLPQTGENSSQSQAMSFVGILLAMFGGLLGFLGIKKRRND